MPVDSAASKFRHQLHRDVEMVSDRCRKCVDEADRVEQERRKFVDAIDKTADRICEIVSHSASVRWQRQVNYVKCNYFFNELLV